jgi:hypothetical protein
MVCIGVIRLITVFAGLEIIKDKRTSGNVGMGYEFHFLFISKEKRCLKCKSSEDILEAGVRNVHKFFEKCGMYKTKER